MPGIEKLRALSVSELLQELRARKAKPGESESLQLSTELRKFNDQTIIAVVREKQKVVYGTDDRIDLYQLPVGPNLDDADSVVALFGKNAIVDNHDGTSSLITQNFGTAFNLCAGEPFREQPCGAFCSGFLVAKDIIATAGHCVDASNVTDVCFVFGFRMSDSQTAKTVIENDEIYRGVAVIGRQMDAKGADWSLVLIDRAVTNHRIALLRQTGKIGNTQALHVIGHPCGLPTKFAGGANVRSNQDTAFFAANLDTYGGNSGSPVFNSNTHVVEGVLCRGMTDFVEDGSCNVSLICPDTGCGGETCTRTTEFSHLHPFTRRGEFYAVDRDGSISLLKKHIRWRQSWKQIIPGNFGGNALTDLLFYDPSTGQGEFYTTDGNGNISLLKKHTAWRQSWKQIIPGNFGGNVFTDLLFYDPSTGQGEFYATDGNGSISLLKKHTGWRKSWTQIIPGNFGGNAFTDLLFYDPSTGQGEFYVTDGNGNISLLKQHTGWRKSWSLINPISFGSNTFNNLLFYDPSTGQGEFYTTDGNGSISLLKKHTGWRKSWTQIIPGRFGGSNYVGLLFYDPMASI